MLKRIWHFLFGHKYVERSTTFNSPKKDAIPSFPDYTESYKHHLHGFTDIISFCYCGAHKTTRLVGNHSKGTAGDSELQDLRKMASI